VDDNRDLSVRILIFILSNIGNKKETEVSFFIEYGVLIANQ